MRIVSCHIAGFGRLKDYKYDFERGLNAEIRENGWGKTTFCVFLKAMFYGMDYSRRKTLTEREHYQPWDGGVYGGNLVFEVGDRTYRIERTFGTTDKKDTFKLFDHTTGLESTDYTENIGEELFMVDRVSFEKSIFLPQEALKTGMTDSLNAKMGDIALRKDDINNFDLAVKRLKDARLVYTKNSKVNPGKLMAIKQEIAKCREAIEQIMPLAEGYDKQQNILEEKRSRLDELNEQKARLTDTIRHQSKREQELGKYREKNTTLEKRRAEFEELSAFFENGVPAEAQLTEYDEIERQLQFDITHLDAALSALPEPRERERLDELFEENPLSREDLERWDDQAEKILTLRVRGEHTKMDDEDKAQLTELKQYFSKHVPTSEELAAAEQSATNYVELSGKIQTLEDQYKSVSDSVTSNEKAVKRREGRGPSSFGVFMLLGVIFVIGAFAFFQLDNERAGFFFGVGCCVAALIMFWLGIAMAIRRRKEKKQLLAHGREALEKARVNLEEKKSERDRYLKDCETFLEDYPVTLSDSYLKMISEIQRKADIYNKLSTQEDKLVKDAGDALDELASMQTELYTQLAHYSHCYHMDLYEDHEESDILQQLSEDWTAYSKMKKDRSVQETLAEEARKGKEELFGFIGKYPVEEPSRVDRLKENLMLIRKNLDDYLETKSEVEALEKELQQFAAESDIREETKSVEDLTENQARIDEEIAEVSAQITKGMDDLSEIAEELGTLEERGDALPDLQAREKKYRRRVERYDRTIGYLQQAKEQFLARYMGPLRDGLKRYLAMIFGDEADIGLVAEDFTLDMDLEIRIFHNGSTHESGYLSAGFMDLSSVCARLALIDVLYTKEKPMIILDDPFANLDKDKAVQALGLISRLAKDRQIIYFSCHESRMPQRKDDVAGRPQRMT